MYIFTYKQLQWVVSGAALLLMGGAFIFGSRFQFAQTILITIGFTLLSLSILDKILGRKFVAYGLFGLSIFLSFSHFLLNFGRDQSLVALVYVTSFLTLFGLLVTNFQEKNLTQL